MDSGDLDASFSLERDGVRRASGLSSTDVLAGDGEPEVRLKGVGMVFRELEGTISAGGFDEAAVAGDDAFGPSLTFRFADGGETAVTTTTDGGCVRIGFVFIAIFV